jgi:hypothetical protein
MQTIFGMVEFFDVDNGNDNKLNVSPAWMVYWKVTIPMTVVLVLFLFVWFNRKPDELPPPPTGAFMHDYPGTKGWSPFARFPWGGPPPGRYFVDDEEKRLKSSPSWDDDKGWVSPRAERFWHNRHNRHVSED